MNTTDERGKRLDAYLAKLHPQRQVSQTDVRELRKQIDQIHSVQFGMDATAKTLEASQQRYRAWLATGLWY